MQPNFESFRLRFLEKKRLRFFSLFIALSFLFWIITKLSNSYSSSVNFEVNFVDVPNLIFLNQDLEKSLKADITASGFQLLMYQYFKNKINISLENVDFSGHKAKVNLMDQKFNIRQQLFQNVILNLISPSNLTFSYSKLKRKKIPVIPAVQLNFKPGYNREGEWEIEPDSVWVNGLSQKIDTLKGVFINSFTKENIDDDIIEEVKLIQLDQIKYETDKVFIKAKVKRFTEKSIETFINIKNLPDSLAIKLFPQSLKVTFLVLIDKAEVVKPSNFSFFCDYMEAQSTHQNTLEILLEMEPEGVRNLRWSPEKVDYLIRK